MLKRLSISILLSLAFAGCADTAEGKGEEDALPVDGAADSFRSPTEHGNLPFGITANADLGADSRFHAWEFSLSGESSVDIVVASENPNLDTVAYLYHRENEDENWGRYIARNDDASDSVLTSRIDGERDAGEYRLIVKGFKAQHVGPFTVVASCSGLCGDGPTEVEFPGITGFGEDCAYQIQDVFRAPSFETSGFNVSLDDVDALDANLRIAVGLYEGDFGDQFEDYEVDNLDVSVQRADTGEVISVEIPGADEATIYYVFDDRGQLLAHYWSNQSPIAEFYCNEDGESAPEPDAECLSALLFYGESEATVETSMASYTYERGGSNDLPELVNTAADYFANTILGRHDELDTISLEVESWGDGARVVAGELTYGAAEIWVIEDYIVFSSYENDDVQSTMVCERTDR